MEKEELLEEFELAQREVAEDLLPPEPEDGFEQFLGKLEKRLGLSGPEGQ